MLRTILFPALISGFMAFAPAHATDRSEDLSAFRTDFFEVDNSFSVTARTQANVLLHTLEQEADVLSDAAFELKLAEIVATADNGHTLFFSGLWRMKFNRAPIKTVILANRLYIADADSPYENLEGAEVTHIGGRPWPEVREELDRYQGGLRQWKAEFLRFFLESPEVMHAAGLSDSAYVLLLSGTDAEGNAFETSVAGSEMAPDYKGSELFIPPSRLLELSGGKDENPLYLQDGDAHYRFQWLDKDIAYIQFKANAGKMNGIDAINFSNDVMAKLYNKMPRQVILDQRFNAGGDLNNTRDLMQALPDLTNPSGAVYVITSGHTFSAGISSVGYLKQTGGDRVIIVGEPVGDRMEFWAEGDLLRLPKSGAAILFATERHNYQTGCTEEDCHGSIKRHPISVETLAPDYITPLTYEDFTSGHDPAMDKIMLLIGAE